MNGAEKRRVARMSVGAAIVLIVLKLWAGLSSDSLGLVSEALHSGVDLVAALLMAVAIGVAIRPADRDHPYGHGKAEHLAALAEATVLIGASLFIAGAAIFRIADASHPGPSTEWWVFVVLGAILSVDASRAWINLRVGRAENSAALRASALHFASDFLGTLVVLGGLLAARAGYPQADAWAALVIAVVVIVSAGRIIRGNVNVLMDTAPPGSEQIAADAIRRLDPPVELRRLRIRQAGGQTFADAVIAVPGDAAVAQGHTAADSVEAAVAAALGGADVVVHVEPYRPAPDTQSLVETAARSVPGVRDVHNIRIVTVPGGAQIALHFRLPGDTSLVRAHDIATSVEAAVAAAVDGVTIVHTHIEPLEATLAASHGGGTQSGGLAGSVDRVIRETTGRSPRIVRLVDTAAGTAVFATVLVDQTATIRDAHGIAHELENRLRELPFALADVVVHTEPAQES